MNSPGHRIHLAAILGLACLSAGLAVAAWAILRPRPSLARVGTLAKAGRFDEALGLVGAYLRAYPDDARARLMAAELELERPEPRPEPALDHLGRIATDDRRLAARARLDEGKASYLLGRFDRAEARWREALDLDPLVPEAAWALLDLYYTEGRREDARALALRQYAIEPDRQDRARMLLELIRQDAEPVDPASAVGRFEATVRRDPDEFRASVALGLALIRSGHPDRGVATLLEAARRHPDEPDARDALLTGLDDADRLDDLAAEVDRPSKLLEGDPRLDKHRGRAAQARGDWPAAARAYRRAWGARPFDLGALHRLEASLRRSGDLDGVRALEGPRRAAQAARDEVRALYAEAEAGGDFGKTPDRRLYQRLAENRERLGRADEARAWHQLVLRDFPDDPISLEAVARLK